VIINHITMNFLVSVASKVVINIVESDNQSSPTHVTVIASEHMNKSRSLWVLFTVLLSVQSGQDDLLEMNANKATKLHGIAHFCIPHITSLLQEL